MVLHWEYHSVIHEHCTNVFCVHSVNSIAKCISVRYIFIFPSIPSRNRLSPPAMADMTDLQACQVPSAQSWCHVTPPAACQKLIVLIGERQSCNKALRGNPPTQMKALRFVLCQGLVGNRHIRWPVGPGGQDHSAVAGLCVEREEEEEEEEGSSHWIFPGRRQKLENKKWHYYSLWLNLIIFPLTD